jgi:hypothetical protein
LSLLNYYITCICFINYESLNSDGHQFHQYHQYQQSEQSPLILTELTDNKQKRP